MARPDPWSRLDASRFGPSDEIASRRWIDIRASSLARAVAIDALDRVAVSREVKNRCTFEHLRHVRLCEL